MKKFRSPCGCGLEMNVPYEEGTAGCLIVRGAQGYAGLRFY